MLNAFLEERVVNTIESPQLEWNMSADRTKRRYPYDKHPHLSFLLETPAQQQWLTFFRYTNSTSSVQVIFLVKLQNVIASALITLLINDISFVSPFSVVLVSNCCSD